MEGLRVWGAGLRVWERGLTLYRASSHIKPGHNIIIGKGLIRTRITVAR